MNRRVSLHQLIACAVASLLFAGCGGGGGGDTPSAAPPAPAVPTTPAATPSVQSIAPLEGAVDTVVTVSGSGLSRVTTVMVNAIPATYTIVSDSQLTFRVPAMAPSGPVWIAGQGFNVSVTSMFRIIGTPTVSAVSATTAPVSSNITLNGQYLDQASAFYVGQELLAVASVSPSTATVRAPSTPVSGRLVVQDRSGAMRPTVHTISVWSPISITSISPSSALPGDMVTVNGTGLQAVNAVSFTSTPLASINAKEYATVPTSQTDTSLTVTVPSTASTGSIAVFSQFQPGGVQTTATLTVLPKVAVSRLDPVVTPPTPPPPPGYENGELLYKQKVNFPVTGATACQDCHGPAYIFRRTAVQIAAAISTNRGGMSVYSSWTAAQIGDIVTYMDNVQPPPSLPPSTAATISRIDVQGSRLLSVTSARIGGTAAMISSQSSSALTLIPTTPITVGSPQSVRFSVPGNADFEAGVINVQNNGALYLFGAEAAQVHSKQIDSPTLRLTPGRPFMVRAAVLSTGSVLAPSVTATVSKNGVPRGTLPMTGPAVLQSTYDVYSNSSMFSAVIPGAWVEPGIQVTVSVATAPAMQMTFSPSVGRPARLQFVLVPVQIGALLPTLPLADAVRDALARIFPVASQDISVTTRAPVMLSLQTPLNDLGYARILSELEARRLAEGPEKVYYGVIPRGAFQTSGLATSGALGQALSIPDLINPSTWKMTAYGYDYSFTWTGLDRFGLQWSEFMTTMLHEVGHLHSRRHAPCGPAAGPDPNYPAQDYPAQDGRIGTEPLYSSTYADGTPGTIALPTLPDSPPLFTLVHPGFPDLAPNGRIADVMGYCGSAWFSAHNYGYVQQFLENRTAAQVVAVTQARAKALAALTEPQMGYLVLSGQITEQGLTMAPAQVLPSPPIAPHSGGPYTMTIRTAAGETVLAPFVASPMGEGDAMSFTVVIPDPGPVAGVEVTKSMRVIPQIATRARARAQGVGAPSAPRASVSWALDREHVAVKWNVAAEPALSVTLVYSDGRREVIVSDLTGGDVRVATGKRPPGTRVELNLGSDVSARTIAVN